ncbi:MAG: cytochrome c [Nitrospirota bacterium]|nr:MAG: cytochrome c [Nitrospirota bacterium]
MQKSNSPLAKILAEVVFWVTIIFLSLFPYPQGALAEEEDLAKGKALYEKHCAVCHGPEGKGDGYTLLDPPPADLTSEVIQKKSYDELWHEVHDGIPDTAMGMWKVALSDAEITMVLAYVRTLAQ